MKEKTGVRMVSLCVNLSEIQAGMVHQKRNNPGSAAYPWYTSGKHEPSGNPQTNPQAAKK